MTTEPKWPGFGGLLDSLSRFAATVAHIVQTRLELLSTDVAEARLNVVRTTLVVLGVLTCLQAGLLMAVLFVVLAVGERNQLAAIGIAALVLLLGAAGGVWWLYGWLKRRPPLFAATIEELRKDRERLGHRP